MMRLVLLWVAALSHVVVECLAARILVVTPFPGKSHHIFTTAIMKALAQRGHHVVEYSPYPPQSTIPNHTHVELHTSFEKKLSKWTYEDFIAHSVEFESSFYGFKVRRIWIMNQEICEDTFKDPKIQQLLNSERKFDLVLLESTFGQESLLAFGYRFSAPTVTIETFVPWVIPNWAAGNSLSSGSVPDLLSTTLENEHLSLNDRIYNIISIVITLVSYHQWHLPYHEALVKQHFPQPGTPSVSDMVSNVSLYLTNSHPSAVNYIQPYTPNIVPVGGLHIPEEKTPLPASIKSFLDGAKEGFIFFSLGTVVPTQHFPKEILQIFTNVFRRLPQKVLWKIGLNKLDGVPKNVMIIKWAPQLGVLEHPNCQLFITHGGLFSHHEAIYAGVPTVGIPFFADQPYNQQYSIIRGRGLKLDFESLTEETLYSAVSSVLTNPKFKEAASRLSRVYQDRPIAPLDNAIFWLEYVLRHGGASLRPASTHLSWYQLALLDVVAVVLVTVSVLAAVMYTLVKWLLKLCCRQKDALKTSLDKKIK